MKATTLEFCKICAVFLMLSAMKIQASSADLLSADAVDAKKNNALREPSSHDGDLSVSETFGFGYYPRVYSGYDYWPTFGGYGRRRGHAYDGFGGGYGGIYAAGDYHRFIYPFYG